MSIAKSNQIKIYFIGFLFFFTSLIYIDNTLEVKNTRISEIDLGNLNDYVSIYGKPVKQKRFNNTLFIEIQEESSTIKGIIFNNNVSLDQNKKYIFEGKIVYYKEDIEIIIDRIKH